MVTELAVNKPQGWTPLEAINRLRWKLPFLKNKKMSYCGRLDPMAEGVLVILVGDGVKQIDKFKGKDKTYEVQVLLGLKTDTYDVLGVIGGVNVVDFDCVLNPTEEWLEKVTGCFYQNYPPFSAVKVKGKALFEWAKLGRLSEVDIPGKLVRVYWNQVVGWNQVKGREIGIQARKRIGLVKGEFRQREIQKSWEKFSKEYGNQIFTCVKIIMKVSSGTYVRSIANELGSELGCGAIAWQIKRIQVGDFGLDKCIEVEN